jgi:hypothetical protein
MSHPVCQKSDPLVAVPTNSHPVTGGCYSSSTPLSCWLALIQGSSPAAPACVRACAPTSNTGGG